jgi:hypothetical protein
MAYYEYKDLFDKAQETGKYHMFIFDIVHSRTYGKRVMFIEFMSRLMIKRVYNKLQDLEKERHKQILHKSEDVIPIYDGRAEMFIFREPFQFGDLFGFTVLRDSISSDEVYGLVEDEIKKYNDKFKVDWEFHMLDGYYETDDYGEGGTQYYRGYCLPQLEELSKNQNMDQRVLRKRKKLGK